MDRIGRLYLLTDRSRTVVRVVGIRTDSNSCRVEALGTTAAFDVSREQLVYEVSPLVAAELLSSERPGEAKVAVA